MGFVTEFALQSSLDGDNFVSVKNAVNRDEEAAFAFGGGNREVYLNRNLNLL